MAIDTDFKDLCVFFRSDNGPTARGQRAIARDQSRGRSEEGEPKMENSKHSNREPQGEIKVKRLDFGKGEVFTVQSKASEEEIKELDKISMVAYMLDLYNNPTDKKPYEKQFFKRLCQPHGRSGASVNNVNKYI